MPCKGIALPAELPARSLILYYNKSCFVNLSEGVQLNSSIDSAKLSAILKQRIHAQILKYMKELVNLKGYSAIFGIVIIFRKIQLSTTE